jgi:hypothetical protein
MFQDFTTDVKFNDNAKAVFGTGNDLQIYHDGSNSFIKDAGAGNLSLNGDNEVYIANAADTEYKARFITNGAVTLYYDNAAKIATTSTGIDVTGNIIFGDNHAIVSDGNDNLVIESSSSEDVIIKAGSGVIEFRDAGESGSPLRTKIDTDGNLLVGKSSSSGYTTGIELRPYGLLTASRDSAAAVLVNRTTTEGAIISLAKDGAAVGSIGNNTDFYIASQDGCGLRFTNNQVLPCSESGATQTTSRDLGSSGARFRDLYTSGGVYLGGPGAANQLDDYEEGSWTPSMSGMGNASFSQQFGSYTKIGNLAHVTGKIAWSGATGTASVNITGIPFTGADASDHLLRNSAWPQGDYVNINTLIDRNGHFRIDTNVLFGVIDNTSGSTIAMQCGTHVASSGEFNFYLVYRTT